MVAHNTAAEPIFTYGNETALRLFSLSWQAFTALPSSKSAEPLHREKRQRLRERVARDGYIDDYQGIRISSDGRRFRIEEAAVWNLIDQKGNPCGQAAMFSKWLYE